MGGVDSGCRGEKRSGRSVCVRTHLTSPSARASALGWAGTAAFGLAVPVVACPPMAVDALSGEEHDRLAVEAWEAGPASVDPKWLDLLEELWSGADGLAGLPSPAQVGQWSSPLPWPVIAIHAATMPDGRVLHYSYPDATPGSRARLWNPSTGTFAQVNVPVDIFCSGLSHLADGRLYVTGGNDYACNFQGRNVTFTFDGDGQAWVQQESMAAYRWYPTNLTLDDGRVMVVSGLDQVCSTTPIMEIFDPESGLSVWAPGFDYLALYPRLHLLSDGRVAYVGPEAWAKVFDLTDVEASGFSFVAWQTQACYRDAVGSVLLPGFTDRIMVFGGSCGIAYNSVETIDFAQASPAWTPLAPMHIGRKHHNPVILPDGSVLAIGGGGSGLYDEPVNLPERYDPVSNTWTVLAPHVYSRMYHSTAQLIPDGRVIVAGQDSGPSAYFGEIYSPPYLFRGPRPEMVETPISIGYGQSFALEALVPGGTGEIHRVALVRLGAATHSTEFDQRHLWLAHAPAPAETPGAKRATVVAPAKATLAPPGHYMLFVLDSDLVPSVARIVRLGGGVFGDLNGDGLVNGADLGLLLAAWGTAGPGDLDGSGSVRGADLGLLLAAWGG